MYVKKSISLLLSGALFASLCTGCSQTTMEHHFFTDTKTETEYITPINEIDVTTRITELENLLAKHGIELEVRLAPSIMPSGNLPFLGSLIFDDSRQYSDITKANLVEEIDDFIAKKQQHIFACYTEESPVKYDAYDYLDVVLQNLDGLYNALDKFEDMNWENLKDALDGKPLLFTALRYYTDSTKGEDGETILNYVIETGLSKGPLYLP